MELLERQGELEELARHLRDSAGTAGRLTLICGEAGVGKSALVEQFARQAQRPVRLLCDRLEVPASHTFARESA
jgi:predicted ATPase